MVCSALRCSVLVGGLLLAESPLVWAQQSLSVESGSPEGKQIAAIEHETDAAKKQALLEEFAKSASSKSLSSWAYAQMQVLYSQGQQYDKVLEAGQLALTLNPNNLDAAYAGLKAAEAKGDLDALIKWAGETQKITSKSLGAPGATDANSVARADYVKQVGTYADYSLFAACFKTTDPAKIVALVEALEKQDAASPYLGQVYGRYLNALQQSGQTEKALQAADRELQRKPDSEDSLLLAAGANLQQKQDQKAVAYAQQLISVMHAKAPPEGMSAADWQKKKDTTLGIGYWIAGVGSANLRHYQEADKALRQALPLIKGNPETLGIGLFHLGVVDYELGKAAKNKTLLQDALKFSQQSAALKSPLQAQARANMLAIRKQLGVAR